MKTHFIALAALATLWQPAYCDHLSSGSTWKKLGYYTDCGKWQTVSSDQREKLELKNWLSAFKNNLIACSTPQERDFEDKHVSCSLKLTCQAQLTDIQIDQSSGSSEMDSKFMSLIKRVDLKRMPPPPNTAPFKKVIIVGYAGSPATLSVSLKDSGK